MDTLEEPQLMNISIQELMQGSRNFNQSLTQQQAPASASSLNVSPSTTAATQKQVFGPMSVWPVQLTIRRVVSLGNLFYPNRLIGPKFQTEWYPSHTHTDQ